MDGLFQSQGLRAFPTVGVPSVSMQLVVLPGLRDRNELEESSSSAYREDLATFVDVMRSAPLPWIRRPEIIDVFDHMYFIFRRRGFEPALRVSNPGPSWSEALFSIFAVLAVAFEVAGEKFGKEFEGWAEHADFEAGPMGQQFYALLLARSNNVRVEEIEEHLSQCGFSQAGEAFVRRWICREISLISIDKSAGGVDQNPGVDFVPSEAADVQGVLF